MTNRRRRNSLQIKIELLEAVGKALVKHGHTHLGINNVSIEAGIEKASIYRHFSDFNDLLRSYIEKQDYWLLRLKEYGESDVENTRMFTKTMLTEELEVLFKNKELQKLLIWELDDEDDIVTSLALKREIMAEKLLAKGKDILVGYGINFNFILAILIAGIYYLVLHKDKSTFCDMDLNKKADRDELSKSIEWLVDLIYDKAEKVSEAESIAVKAHKAGVEIEKIVGFTGISSERIQELI